MEINCLLRTGSQWALTGTSTRMIRTESMRSSAQKWLVLSSVGRGNCRCRERNYEEIQTTKKTCLKQAAILTISKASYSAVSPPASGWCESTSATCQPANSRATQCRTTPGSAWLSNSKTEMWTSSSKIRTTWTHSSASSFTASKQLMEIKTLPSQLSSSWPRKRCRSWKWSCGRVAWRSPKKYP